MPALMQSLLGTGGRRSGVGGGSGPALSPHPRVQHGVLPAPKGRQVALAAQVRDLCLLQRQPHPAQPLHLQARRHASQGAGAHKRGRGVSAAAAAAAQCGSGSGAFGAAEQLVQAGPHAAAVSVGAPVPGQPCCPGGDGDQRVEQGRKAGVC